MASSGPNLPSAAASLANSGTSENANAWQNVANIYGTGSASITAATFDSPDISEILVASGFGFSVSGRIDGITVVINKRGYTSTDSGKDYRVQLSTTTAFSGLVGSNKASASVWPAGTLADTTYGSTSDTWSASLTDAQVNSSGFAVFVSAYANVANADIDVNSITVTITYTPPVLVQPAAAAISIAGGTPTVTVGANILVQPAAAAISVAGSTPTIVAQNWPKAQPAAAAISIAGATPAIATPVTIAPSAAAITIGTATATIVAQDWPKALPAAAAVAITTATPTIVAQNYILLSPVAAAIAIAGDTPAVVAQNYILRQPDPAVMSIAGDTPVVVVTSANEFPAELAAGTAEAILVNANIAASSGYARARSA